MKHEWLGMICGGLIVMLLASVAQAAIQISSPSRASAMECLAAREVARYLYLRTGLMPAAIAQNGRVVIARRGQAAIEDATVRAAAADLKPQQFILRTTHEGGRTTWWIIGGDDLGTLYAAYHFCEMLGVRFYLHGDIVPDEWLSEIPEIDETGKPLFSLRGLNPWGSHPFGFDQWSADDYKAIIAQITKMRMNFLGIHCYPEGLPYAEPTVWLGLEGDFDAQGRVQSSYPAQYFSTAAKTPWGPMLPRKTGDYLCGGAQLFEGDDWGPDVMRGMCPAPVTSEACNELFNRTGAQLHDAFGFARQLGVKTCLGTETPLVMPAVLRARLQAKGKNPNDPVVVRKVYEGIFRRIMATHPLDYYWIWTPERDIKLPETKVDLKLALEAAKNVQAPFELAVCGWGWLDQNFVALDAVLPKSVPFSCLNEGIGYLAVSTCFAAISGREKWAIPWMEGDGGAGLAATQLWVGRMRQDAALALAYGCTGLMGLQWRTESLAPNASALAQAGWDQSGWNPQSGAAPNVKAQPIALSTEASLGGQTADYITQTQVQMPESPVYLTCRYNMQGYRIKAPKGVYRVTLKFCEPHFSAANQRVFDVSMQGKTVIEALDIFAKVGQFKPYDKTIENVRVDDGVLHINFINGISWACISGIVIESHGLTKKINCGGLAWQDYIADTQSPAQNGNRSLSSDDFYADWARIWFGPDASAEIAAIFTKIDGKLPPSVVDGCPSGKLAPDPMSWDNVAPKFNCVDELEALRPKVRGIGNLDRFDYWLNSLRYHRDLGRIRCALGEFEAAMKNVEAEKNVVQRKSLAAAMALPAYQKVIAAWSEAYRDLLTTVNSNGALATVVNMENDADYRLFAIDEPAQRLEAALGAPLPAAAIPPRDYQGLPRLIVPTVRSLLGRSEALNVKVIVLDKTPASAVTLCWRPLGRGEFQKVELKHLARAVYVVTLPPAPPHVEAIEYYLEADIQGGKLHYPATAPRINQTVVILE